MTDIKNESEVFAMTPSELIEHLRSNDSVTAVELLRTAEMLERAISALRTIQDGIPGAALFATDTLHALNVREPVTAKERAEAAESRLDSIRFIMDQDTCLGTWGEERQKRYGMIAEVMAGYRTTDRELQGRLDTSCQHCGGHHQADEECPMPPESRFADYTGPEPMTMGQRAARNRKADPWNETGGL